MRALTEMDNETEARRFGDYLYAQGIPNDVDEDEGEWTIWIHDDDQLAVFYIPGHNIHLAPRR